VLEKTGPIFSVHCQQGEPNTSASITLVLSQGCADLRVNTITECPLAIKPSANCACISTATHHGIKRLEMQIIC
jgi:hypothetical protein